MTSAGQWRLRRRDPSAPAVDVESFSVEAGCPGNLLGEASGSANGSVGTTLKRPAPSCDATACTLDVEDTPSVGESRSSSGVPKQVEKRQRCRYGASCYRRNLEHKADFSHPGDPDWNAMGATSVINVVDLTDNESASLALAMQLQLQEEQRLEEDAALARRLQEEDGSVPFAPARRATECIPSDRRQVSGSEAMVANDAALALALFEEEQRQRQPRSGHELPKPQNALQTVPTAEHLLKSQLCAKPGADAAQVLPLLRECLKEASASDPSLRVVVFGGQMEHYQAEKIDEKFGCGYRNMQMLASSLLHKGASPNSSNCKAGAAIFGGLVPGLDDWQKWLERAWAGGFDTVGAAQMGWRVSGTSKWIGATDAAACLRQFGLRAELADFSVPGGDEKMPPRGCCYKCGREGHWALNCTGNEGVNVKDQRSINVSREVVVQTPRPTHEARASHQSHRHKPLLQYVWSYFMGNHDCRSGPASAATSRSQIDDGSLLGEGMLAARGVHLSKRLPLFFQHQGHSRTIVGAMVRGMRGKEEAFMLVFDPASRTDELVRSLRARKGWQARLMRGLHTLRKADYQLLFVADDGEGKPAAGEELEALKVIRPSFMYRSDDRGTAVVAAGAY